MTKAGNGAVKGAPCLEKRGLRENLLTRHNSREEGAAREGWAQLPGNRDRMRENDLKLCRGRFRLDISKIFITEIVVKHWNRLPWGVGESPSLEMFKKHLGVAHEDMF